MKSYKLCHYAAALGKHPKHSKTRQCKASLASCQTQKPFPAISGTLHSKNNQNISRFIRKPSTIMVVKIPHCVISRNIQQSTHHRDCKTKPFLLMQPCPNAHLCRPKKDRAQRMQASIHDGESCATLSCNSYHAKICHGRISCFLVLKTHWSIAIIPDPDCWQARNLQNYLQTLNDHGGKDSALRAQGKYSASSHHRDCSGINFIWLALGVVHSCCHVVANTAKHAISN